MAKTWDYGAAVAFDDHYAENELAHVPPVAVVEVAAGHSNDAILSVVQGVAVRKLVYASWTVVQRVALVIVLKEETYFGEMRCPL